MNIRCLFGHDWKKISDWLPIKNDDEFNTHVRIMALGKCRNCGIHKPRTMGGQFEYYASDKATIEEAMKKWEDQLEQSE